MTIQVEHPDYPDRTIEIEPMTPMSGTLRNLVKKMQLKCEDPGAKFHDHEPTCRVCFGSGLAPIYQKGIRKIMRCPASFWDATEKKLRCRGNADWRDWDNSNKKDLCNAFWKLAIELKLSEEGIQKRLRDEYNVDWPDELLVEQIELILVKLNHAINKKYTTNVAHPRPYAAEMKEQVA